MTLIARETTEAIVRKIIWTNKFLDGATKREEKMQGYVVLANGMVAPFHPNLHMFDLRKLSLIDGGRQLYKSTEAVSRNSIVVMVYGDEKRTVEEAIVEYNNAQCDEEFRIVFAKMITGDSFYNS